MQNLLSCLLLLLVLVGGAARAVPGLDDPLDSPVVALVTLLPPEPTGAVDLLQGETAIRVRCISAPSSTVSATVRHCRRRSRLSAAMGKCSTANAPGPSSKHLSFHAVWL